MLQGEVRCKSLLGVKGFHVIVKKFMLYTGLNRNRESLS